MFSPDVMQILESAWTGVDKSGPAKGIMALGLATYRAQALEALLALVLTLVRISKQSSRSDAEWEKTHSAVRKMTLGKLCDELRETGRHPELVAKLDEVVGMRNDLAHRFLPTYFDHTLSDQGWKSIQDACMRAAEVFGQVSKEVSSLVPKYFADLGVSQVRLDEEVVAMVRNMMSKRVSG